MRVTGLNTKRVYNLDVGDYLIDWKPAREVSAPQARVKDFLYPYWKTQVVTEELRIPGSKLRIDLINWQRRVAIEVSPSSSHSFNKWFHKDRARFSAAVKRDLDKEQWCVSNRLTYIELTDEDIEQLSVAWFKTVHKLTL